MLFGRYMKYLYPFECETLGLSTPAELQAAIDGNRREGHRTSGPPCGPPGCARNTAGGMKHEQERDMESDGEAGDGTAVGEDCAIGEDEEREPESDELLDGERDDSRSPASPDEHRPDEHRRPLSTVAPPERADARAPLPSLPPLSNFSGALQNLPLLALEKLLPALAQQMPLSNFGLAAAAAAAFSAQQQHHHKHQQAFQQEPSSSQPLSLTTSQTLLQPAPLMSTPHSQLTHFEDGLHCHTERNGTHRETSGCPKRPLSASEDSSAAHIKRERRLHSSALS